MPAQGARIREQRKHLKMTQARLAEKIGVSKVAISNWENDVYSPEGENLDNLLKLFDVSADYLLGQTDTPRNASPGFRAILNDWIDEPGTGGAEALASKSGIPLEEVHRYAAGEKPNGSRMHRLMQAMGYDGKDGQPPTRHLRMAGNGGSGTPVIDMQGGRGDIVRIPILSPVKSACCGAGFPNSEEIYADMTDYLDMPSAIVGTISSDPELRPYFIYADGDSMINAGIIHGSMALVNPAEPVYDGESALVVYGVDGNIAIKRVYWLDNGAVRVSSADDTGWTRTFTREEIQDEKLFRIIGKIMFAGVKPKRG